ncbi:hypothetical protein [Burkholderia glumae]|uniref:hypothetical protein n=1 Tax=Burkholderia glumae TaxID=337 RepID=UPI002151C4B7|nr:hypothetical protein [Burkholderia glumae]
MSVDDMNEAIQKAASDTSEVLMRRKKPKFADLLAQCDPSAAYAGEVWPEAQPVGREFGAAATSLEQLRGSVRRYDDPTGPVWPSDDEPS